MKAIGEKTKQVSNLILGWAIIEGPQIFVTFFR